MRDLEEKGDIGYGHGARKAKAGIVAIRSLNQLKKLRLFLTGLRRKWLCRTPGVEIDPSASISLSSQILCHKGGSIIIGPDSLIAFKTLLYTYDPETGRNHPVRIGRNCFIGGGAMIAPGVTVHDGSIVAAGAVVLQDVPPASIVAGNPAKVIRQEIEVGRFGRLKGADDNTRRMWQA